MRKRVTKLDRMRQRGLLSRAVRLIVPLLIVIPLVGCATPLTPITSEAICSGWKPIKYSTKADHPSATLRAQIIAHNLFGIRRKCWVK